jgi:putative heme-binding domain-containing protein
MLGIVSGSGLIAQFEGSKIQVADGFEVKRVYSVPGDTQGSWVALCVDNKGRLIAGDQNGGLFRITLKEGEVKSVDPLELEVGYVNGLVYAFDSLYAVVAEDEFQGGGLYRIRDLDADDVYDDVQFLRGFVAKGEHGPHSVVPGPDGASLYVISGNKTPLPTGGGFKSLVPDHWGEDDLLPRLWGPIGSEKGTTAPGGWIVRTDPDGKTWELIAIGFRNAFDVAFNQAGDLFTTDADAEFDMATPWYQPTRLLHVVTGTDFGWRSGSGKWPKYFADTIPPVYEYGPGSPTGITFGYGANFPEKYQSALFACDWSWGRIFVTWMTPNGASYRGETKEFLSGIPLPVADLIVNPFDGDMYFVLGGRDTTSGLYRIRYAGSDFDTREFGEDGIQSNESETLRFLENLLVSSGSESVLAAWPHLSSDDRTIRHAARVVLEHAPSTIWQDRALGESNPVARMTALLGLARAGGDELLPDILGSILELDWDGLDQDQKLHFLRCLEVAFIHMDTSNSSGKVRVRQFLESTFPSVGLLLNAELLKLLVYLESDHATAPAMDLLEAAVTQEDELRFILPLRLHTRGWTGPLRERFFTVLGKAHEWSGGRSLTSYVEMIVEDALASVTEKDREHYGNIIVQSRPKLVSKNTGGRKLVKQWTVNDFGSVTASDLKTRDVMNGRMAFESASCFACHRVNGEGGGLGPDLSAVMRRFSIKDLLESVIEPSKVISDQYGLTVIQKTDGTQLHGKVVNYYTDRIGLQTDSLDSANILRLPNSEISSIRASKISSMPPGLLNIFSRGEILDLVAWLHSLN